MQPVRESELFWELNRGGGCSIYRDASDAVFAGKTSWARGESKQKKSVASLSVVVIESDTRRKGKNVQLKDSLISHSLRRGVHVLIRTGWFERKAARLR